ncbi:FkbM family methyltransferase [Myxococcota bacterium]|nr:FkbM family methyltransferase [Myxococcota bacterium]
MFRELGKEILSRALWSSIGRKNLVRLGRFLSNQGRLDLNNDPRSNGEYALQEYVLSLHRNKQDALCVFDVGANVGEWSCSFAERAKKARIPMLIHAFEPFLGTYLSLQKKLAACDVQQSVKANHLALSSQEGTREFFSLGENVGINSLYEENAKRSDLLDHEVVSIQTTTLDRYCQKESIERIHLLKIDTEGHDFDVLQGCQEMLRRDRIDLIQFEYNHRWIYARHFLKDVFEWSRPFGLRLGKLTPKGIEVYKGWHPELETFRENNYVLFPPRLEGAFPCISWWGEP